MTTLEEPNSHLSARSERQPVLLRHFRERSLPERRPLGSLVGIGLSAKINQHKVGVRLIEIDGTNRFQKALVICHMRQSQLAVNCKSWTTLKKSGEHTSTTTRKKHQA